MTTTILPTKKPRVAWIQAGGTMSTVARTKVDLFDYTDFGSKLDAEGFLSLVPELDDAAEIVPIDYKPITMPTHADWLEMNELIHTVVEEDPDLAGLVMVHGTNSLEETAYFLNLTLKIDIPLVVVGAMRPANGLTADAHMNALCAVRVAAAKQSRGLGVLVVMNGEVHAAREVTKRSTTRLHAFQSPDAGPLGHVDPDGSVTIYRRSLREHTTATPFDVRGLRTLPKVDISMTYASADGVAIDAFIEHGSDGIVSSSWSAGVNTAEEWPALLRARAAGVAVVMCSRVGTGRIQPFERLRRNQIVMGDNLLPQKARILTVLSLAITRDPDVIQDYFNRF